MVEKFYMRTFDAGVFLYFSISKHTFPDSYPSLKFYPFARIEQNFGGYLFSYAAILFRSVHLSRSEIKIVLALLGTGLLGIITKY